MAAWQTVCAFRRNALGSGATAAAALFPVNPDLPLAGKMASIGNNWGPRLSLAIGNAVLQFPFLRLGYGLYFGRVPNGPLISALTQTGPTKGELNFFMHPTDNLNAGGAPPFPNALAGEPLTLVKPGAVEHAPGFRNPEIRHAVASFEESLPGHSALNASAMMALTNVRQFQSTPTLIHK